MLVGLLAVFKASSSVSSISNIANDTLLVNMSNSSYPLQRDPEITVKQDPTKNLGEIIDLGHGIRISYRYDCITVPIQDLFLLSWTVSLSQPSWLTLLRAPTSLP